MNDFNLITIISSLVYGVLGFGIFMLSLWIMEKVTPYSLEKKITEEGNVALGLVMAAVILSLGMIYSAAIG